MLLGDSIADIRMAKDNEIESALKIGFLDVKIEENKSHFEDNFDVIGIDNTSFNEIFEEIKIFNKIN